MNQYLKMYILLKSRCGAYSIQVYFAPMRKIKKIIKIVFHDFNFPRVSSPSILPTRDIFSPRRSSPEEVKPSLESRSLFFGLFIAFPKATFQDFLFPKKKRRSYNLSNSSLCSNRRLSKFISVFVEHWDAVFNFIRAH